ncbi:hypothetical protein ACFS7Z_19655 [Pontibacter toksunensis]|uniref:Uncharacterized protein n=1 Tax=Pontibacter toksunensis TaxID=1332631 RepID=A0ABW6BYC4_9BACT
MNFYFAKLFEEYKRKNDPAEFNITLYISVFYFFLLFGFYLPVSVVVKKLFLSGSFSYNQTVLITTTLSVFVIIVFIVYSKYIKKKYIFELVKKYRGRRMSRFILYILICLLPLFFLLAGATVTVLLSGGKILGSEFKGLF